MVGGILKSYWQFTSIQMFSDKKDDNPNHIRPSARVTHRHGECSRPVLAYTGF